MKPNLKQIKEIIFKAIQKAGFEIDKGDLHIERTKTLEHGHFATNAALLIAGKVGKRPRDTAETIAKQLDDPIFTKVDVADPGFVNIWLEQNFCSKICQELVEDLNSYLRDELNIESGKTMVIDYSHPNIAKPMGVHHLLSTIIGDSIKKIYQKMGYKVIADNFIGDMGTQFGKLIHAIKTWGNLDEIEKNPIQKLLELYVQFHFEADKEVELDDEARAEYKKFEEGDPENRELWKKIVKWSLMEIQPIYDCLGVKFDYMNGESFYEDRMQAILDDGRKKGVIVDGERGAWIIKPDDPNDVPILVRKSDGATLYITRDMARIQYWEKEWHPDLMVNVVDSAQEFYFRQLFEAAQKLNLTTARNIHVSFGRMQFEEGGMSTREGKIIMLNEVLDEAEQRAFKLAKEKGLDLTEEQQKELARIMGVGSIKYNILHQNRISNITFDWDKMLSFEGNSAPYLMYTIARAKSILRKGGIDLSDVEKFDLVLSDNLETQVVLDLMMYPDVLKRAYEEFKPNHIANFLYLLAQNFNTLYNALPVLKVEESIRNSRLLLTGAAITVMEDAFRLLGLEVPEKM